MADIAAELRRLSPDYAPTPLLDLPMLAAGFGVDQVLVKDESKRALGSFKSLGGTYAGLRALARHAGCSIARLCETPQPGLPPLICASDGNHGLAVAAAARYAGSAARVYLHATVPAWRAARIEALGAAIVWVDGTYDDAVDAAARDGTGILIADTTDDPHDPVVADVMAGYGVIAEEIRAQIGLGPRPTHLFVQAGVGGLAAAMAAGLAEWMAPGVIIAVEPEGVACVTAALAAGRPVRLPGSLDTAAEMLSCGEASAPALAVLHRHGAQAMTVTEDELVEAREMLPEAGGPATTASGAAGFAGFVHAARLDMDPWSRVLVLVTEAAPQSLG